MTAPLVADPTLRFTELAAALEGLGFRRDEHVRPLTPDLVPGEPELAAWTRGAARLTYTFNPALALRVLAPEGLDPAIAAEARERLRCLGEPELEGLLAETEPRRLLLGLFAARLLGARGLAGRVAALRDHPEPLVAGAARDAALALGRGPEPEPPARREALILLQAICREAIPVLAELVGPAGAEAVLRLRPRDDDYARVFRPGVAGPVRDAYQALWREPPQLEPLVEGSYQLRVDAAPAGMLGEENELSRRFPGGYRALAPYLRTDRIWLVWRYLRPGAAGGIRYDGLVHLGDRWAWFPRANRVVGALAGRGRG